MKELKVIFFFLICIGYLGCNSTDDYSISEGSRGERISFLLDSFDCRLEYDSVRYFLYYLYYDVKCTKLKCGDSIINLDSIPERKRKLAASDIRLNLLVANPISISGDTISFIMTSVFGSGKGDNCRCVGNDYYFLPHRIVISRRDFKIIELEDYFGLITFPSMFSFDVFRYRWEFENEILNNKENVNTWIYQTIKRKHSNFFIQYPSQEFIK